MTDNIGSGNGLVPSGNEPLPEPMLTQIYVHHMASLGHNGLTHWGLDKIANILQMTFSIAIFWMKIIVILLMFISKGAIDNKAKLFQVMANRIKATVHIQYQPTN